MSNNIFDFKTVDSVLKTRHIHTKRIVIVILIVLLVSAIITLLILYKYNDNFRNFWDYTVLRKEVDSSEITSIFLERENLKYPFAYNKKIVILEKNMLTFYNQDGRKNIELQLNLTKPLYYKSDKYMIIAEEGGNKLYFLDGTNIMWQKDLEGTISKIYVNNSGYVCAVMSNVGYNSALVLFDNLGEELFKTILRTSYCTDVEISNNNKYLAFAEMDTSGTMFETVVKVISIDNAKDNSEEAFIAKYNANSTDMVLNLKYMDNLDLVILYDNYVLLEKNDDEEKIEFEDKPVFLDIDSKNRLIVIEKNKSSLLNVNYIMKVKNLLNGGVSEYKLKNLPKELYVKNDVIAINYGTNVEIVNANYCWLIKKYVSRKEIKNVLIDSSCVSIVYSDEIKIIKI